MKHIGFNHKINEIGLKKAYNTHKGIHIDNDTMFIAGTRNFRDVYDDVTKIPVWGDLKNSKRYRDVEEEIKANPNVKKLVAHSWVHFQIWSKVQSYSRLDRMLFL